MVKFEAFVNKKITKSLESKVKKFDEAHDDIFVTVGVSFIKFETFNRDNLAKIQRFSLDELELVPIVNY